MDVFGYFSFIVDRTIDHYKIKRRITNCIYSYLLSVVYKNHVYYSRRVATVFLKAQLKIGCEMTMWFRKSTNTRSAPSRTQKPRSGDEREVEERRVTEYFETPEKGLVRPLTKVVDM